MIDKISDSDLLFPHLFVVRFCTTQIRDVGDDVVEREFRGIN